MKKIFQLRAQNDLIDHFTTICRKQGFSASEVLRTLMNSYCMEHKKEQKMGKKDITQQKGKKIRVPQFENLQKQEFTIGEMYCGPGGIGMAAKLATLNKLNKNYSFRHAWATDYDPDTCQTYKNNVIKDDKQARVICEDIRKVDLSELGSVDGFLYGFPCNDFSQVGESKGLKGSFGGLYKYGVQYINEHNPLFIFAENVSGLSSANSGNAFEKILEALGSAGKYGYNLTAHLYKFEDYGVPQARHRYIIVGIRKDLNMIFKVPKPSMKIKTCFEAITRPPIENVAHNNELTRQSPVVVKRLALIKPGENAWTAKLPKSLQLNVKGARLSHIYKRLDPKKPAYTITGSGGGGTHVYHWEDNRALTNRERARLQTFPDDFVFYGSKESVRKQIGMAVPVDGARIILEAILQTFAGHKYPSIEPSVGYL